jgi:hypothetical protein
MSKYMPRYHGDLRTSEVGALQASAGEIAGLTATYDFRPLCIYTAGTSDYLR